MRSDFIGPIVSIDALQLPDHRSSRAGSETTALMARPQACKKRLKIDRPCVGSDLAERFEYNVPNPDVPGSNPAGVFFTAILLIHQSSGIKGAV